MQRCIAWRRNLLSNYYYVFLGLVTSEPFLDLGSRSHLFIVTFPNSNFHVAVRTFIDIPTIHFSFTPII